MLVGDWRFGLSFPLPTCLPPASLEEAASLHSPSRLGLLHVCSSTYLPQKPTSFPFIQTNTVNSVSCWSWYSHQA
jgi:hypothetical protein